MEMRGCWLKGILSNIDFGYSILAHQSISVSLHFFWWRCGQQPRLVRFRWLKGKGHSGKPSPSSLCRFSDASPCNTKSNQSPLNHLLLMWVWLLGLYVNEIKMAIGITLQGLNLLLPQKTCTVFINGTVFPSCCHVTLMVPNLAYIHTVVSVSGTRLPRAKTRRQLFCPYFN